MALLCIMKNDFDAIDFNNVKITILKIMNVDINYYYLVCFQIFGKIKIVKCEFLRQ